LSVLDNMLVALACHDDRLSLWRTAHSSSAHERAEQVLSRFRLLEQCHRRVAELPGGMRKLLDIALAMTGEPRLLLLDEPTSGVAAEEKFPMMDTVMQALNDQPLTTLFVEHDMDIVSRYCDRVIAFYSGRVIADDVPSVALAQADVRRYVTGEAHA
jgi:branched-chain amino acid transport system ATP-binding protein